MKLLPGVRRAKWVIVLVAAAVLGLLALYEVLFGRLFPFSPVVTGFSRHEQGGVVVYHHGQPGWSDLSYLSEVVAAEEQYHGLAFRWRPEVFLCRDDSEYRRLTGGKARFIAINGRLFVSARAQADARLGQIDLRIYLTHELSHCLLQQHLSILGTLTMPRWLLEGTAMDCAGQVGVGVYPSKTVVNDAVARGVFCEPADFGTYLSGEKGTAISCPIENKTAFFYSEFGCIVGFLKTRYGAERYRSFLKGVVEGHPLDMERAFEQVYRTKFGDEIARFKSEAKQP